MNVFTRLSATFKSGVERSVARIENHEAIVQASLARSRDSAARANVRLRRLKKDGENLRSQIDNWNVQVEQWTERARKLADSDTERALECLHRRRTAQAALSDCERSMKSHQKSESELESTVAALNQRLEQLQRQHNQFRSREATVEACRAISQLDSNGVQCVEDSFDRWEESLLCQEMSAVNGSSASTALESSGTGIAGVGKSTMHDELKSDFEREELNQSLMEELDQLRSSSDEGVNPDD